MADAAKPAVEPPRASVQQNYAQIAIVIAVGLVALNGAFFFMSMAWADSPEKEAALFQLRGAFAMMSGTIGAASFFAALAPRLIAHGFAAVTGLLEVVFGAVALATGRPPVLGVSLIVAGVIGIGLTVSSFQRSRAAWAFLAALSAVLAICFLFGAPKVRNQLGIGLWTALIYPGIKIIIVVALAMLRDDYRTVTAAAGARSESEARPSSAERAEGAMSIGVGITLILIGALVTIFTYGGALARGGGTYVVAYGPMVAGLGMVVRGLRAHFKS
jgi:hypothetical protein